MARFLGFVNGTFNGSACNYNQSHANALLPAGASLLENSAQTTRAPLTTMSPSATQPPPALPHSDSYSKFGTQTMSLADRMHGMLSRIKAHPWPMLGGD